MPLQTPILFVSSTSEDLRSHREAARDAALGAPFQKDGQVHSIEGQKNLKAPRATCALYE